MQVVTKPDNHVEGCVSWKKSHWPFRLLNPLLFCINIYHPDFLATSFSWIKLESKNYETISTKFHTKQTSSQQSRFSYWQHVILFLSTVSANKPFWVVIQSWRTINFDFIIFYLPHFMFSKNNAHDCD